LLKLNVSGLIDLLDAAYHHRGLEWIDVTLSTLIEMAGQRSGAFLRYTTGYDGGRLRITSLSDLTIIGPDAVPWTEATIDVVERAPFAETVFGQTIGSTLSQLTGLGDAVPKQPAFRQLWKEPVVDLLGITSHDASGHGLQFVVALDQTHGTSARERRLLMRVATHLGASDRLSRNDRTERLDRADVVMAPTGRVLHSSSGEIARFASVKDGLARRDFARRRREDPEAALDVWQGLVDGQWSIVDHFDTDGKRFVLAMKNAPDVAPRADLSPQDRRIAALVAMGHRDKDVAYMLGITPGSVAASLRRIRTALGARTRADIARLWRTPPRDSEDR
jgi:DNA-binding CsgD family transcriptional regulator